MEIETLRADRRAGNTVASADVVVRETFARSKEKPRRFRRGF
jgi:hypothetical protein